MATLTRILAQYKENYNTSGTGSPQWKNKGEIEFHVNMPIEWLMYQEERVVSIIKDMMVEHSNDMCQYEYVSHAPVFHKPVILDDRDFEKRFQMGGR